MKIDGGLVTEATRSSFDLLFLIDISAFGCGWPGLQLTPCQGRFTPHPEGPCWVFEVAGVT